MNDDTVVAIQEHATLRTTNSGLVMLFDREKGVMYELNESASAACQYLSENGPSSLKSLVTWLEEEFEAPRDEIQADVEQLLSDFMAAGLVTADGSGESS